MKLSALDRTERRGQSPADLAESLRHYLYAKYLYTESSAADRRERLRLAAGTEQLEAVEG